MLVGVDAVDLESEQLLSKTAAARTHETSSLRDLLRILLPLRKVKLYLSNSKHFWRHEIRRARLLIFCGKYRSRIDSKNKLTGICGLFSTGKLTFDERSFPYGLWFIRAGALNRRARFRRRRTQKKIALTSESSEVSDPADARCSAIPSILEGWSVRHRVVEFPIEIPETEKYKTGDRSANGALRCKFSTPSQHIHDECCFPAIRAQNVRLHGWKCILAKDSTASST